MIVASSSGFFERVFAMASRVDFLSSAISFVREETHPAAKPMSNKRVTRAVRFMEGDSREISGAFSLTGAFRYSRIGREVQACCALTSNGRKKTPAVRLARRALLVSAAPACLREPHRYRHAEPSCAKR